MSPSPVDTLRVALRGTPFEGSVFLVGGAVRDQILGVANHPDWDFVVLGDAQKLAQYLWDAQVSTIPPVTYPQFGTAMVRMGGEQIEFVTARKEIYRAGSRKPKVEPGNLLEDATRRDFTCNSLMIAVHSGEILDPLGIGMSDLDQKILRTPADPDVTFAEDPLRMLRAVRFRWQLGFAFAPGLEDAIRRQAHKLPTISYERIRDELIKMLRLDDPDDCFRDLQALTLLRWFGPELEEMIGVTQGSYHHLDVWDHSLLVMKLTDKNRLVLRLAGLFHDIGKPETRRVDEDGKIRFFGHEVRGEAITRTVLSRWKFPQILIHDVATLVRHHMRLGSMPVFSKSAGRRVLRDLGELAYSLVDLCEADSRGLKQEVTPLDTEAIRAQLKSIAAETPLEALRSPLNGEEVMSATGLPPGTGIGEILHFLSEQVIEGNLPPGDKKSALEMLPALLVQLHLT